MEDESIRRYFGKIAEIVARIKTCGGDKSEDKVVWKILKTLTPAYIQTT